MDGLGNAYGDMFKALFLLFGFLIAVIIGLIITVIYLLV